MIGAGALGLSSGTLGVLAWGTRRDFASKRCLLICSRRATCCCCCAILLILLLTLVIFHPVVAYIETSRHRVVDYDGVLLVPSPPV